MKNTLLVVVLSVFILIFSLASAQDVPSNQLTILHVGTLLAIPGEPPSENQSIILQGNLINDVREGFLTAQEIGHNTDDVEIIDLSDKFVLPGLMEMHEHLTLEFDDHTLQRLQTQSETITALRTARHAKALLQNGFTTVRNVGDPTGLLFEIKKAINSGLIPGPRLFLAGALISRTGGHGYGIYGDEGQCNDIGSCRKVVRTQVLRGADVIKIATSGGMASEWGGKDAPAAFFDDEIKAIVDTAHALNRKVTAHSHSSDGMQAALRNGVDSIEHGSYLDDATARLFLKKNAVLVPTLLVSIVGVEQVSTVPEFRASMTEEDYQRAISIGPHILASGQLAHKHGVKIAFGTDSGGSVTPRNKEEFDLLVQIGMTEMEAIETATVNTAALLGWQDRIGTLEVGKYADIIAVTGNPLEDISAMQEVVFVMKDGNVYLDDNTPMH
jgi:imidazolonepropionase-like amidohydrolase